MLGIYRVKHHVLGSPTVSPQRFSALACHWWMCTPVRRARLVTELGVLDLILLGRMATLSIHHVMIDLGRWRASLVHGKN